MRHSMQSPEESCPSSTPGRMTLLQWKQTVRIHSIPPQEQPIHMAPPHRFQGHHDQLTALIWKDSNLRFVKQTKELMCLRAWRQTRGSRNVEPIKVRNNEIICPLPPDPLLLTPVSFCKRAAGLSADG